MTIRLRKRNLYVLGVLGGALLGFIWASKQATSEDNQHVNVSMKHVAGLGMALLPMLRQSQAEDDSEDASDA